MKKLKLIPLVFGASALSIVPVFTSSCSSNSEKADQVIILGEKSCHVAVNHTFQHQFTAYVLPTEAPQTVNWSLEINSDNSAIKPFVSISETGLLTITKPSVELADKTFTINVVAKDKDAKNVKDAVPFEIEVDSKLQIVGPQRVIYRAGTENGVGPWTINGDLEGEWKIDNYETAKSNDYLFSEYFEGAVKGNGFTIIPSWLTSWADLAGLSFNLVLTFTPNDPAYKDAFGPLDVTFDVFEPDSMNVVPTEEDNNYVARVDTNKIFTLSNYGQMTFDGLVVEYIPTFNLYPVTKVTSPNGDYYEIGDAIEEGENTFTVDSSDRQNRADYTSPFNIVLTIHNSEYIGKKYFLEMVFYGPGIIELLKTYTCYYTNFIEIQNKKTL